MDGNSANREQNPPAGAADVSATQAPDERLLDGLQHLLGHELPNQLIALQGLLRLFAFDEDDRLTPAAREYLQRLAGVAQRIQTIIQGMVELCRLRHPVEASENFLFADVAGEAAAELSQLFPGRTIDYDFSDVPVRLSAPRGLLRRFLVEVARSTFDHGGNEQPPQIEFGAAVLAAVAEFWVRDRRGTFSGELARRWRQILVEPIAGLSADNVGLFLARQLVERGGGLVDVDCEPERGVRVRVRLSQGKWSSGKN